MPKSTANKNQSAYTPEMEKFITELYAAKFEELADNNAALAEVVAGFNAEFEDKKVTAPAVRSKLVNLGQYQKQEARKVGGASGVRKLSIVRTIETALGLEKGSLDSLEKAAKSELDLLAQSVAK